jgi:FKBP-type peptidyl-prolyl cis-trans isomerase FkpA
MYRNLLLAGILFVSLISGCSKKDEGCPYPDNTITVPASEIAAVETYLNAKGITATKDDRGFYYSIQEAGSGATPGNCNTITIFYTGKLTNDTVFDQTGSSPAAFVLGQLIEGWKKGIPLIKTGGKIILYLPPSLGYGSVANGPIPANSVLIFDIQLVAVN